MTRRSFSRRFLLAGAGIAVLPMRNAFAAGLAASPPHTGGPFYPVSFPADMDNDLVQVRGQAAQAMGTVLHLQGRVLESDGSATYGEQVEHWQCDVRGLYYHS